MSSSTSSYFTNAFSSLHSSAIATFQLVKSPSHSSADDYSESELSDILPMSSPLDSQKPVVVVDSLEVQNNGLTVPGSNPRKFKIPPPSPLALPSKTKTNLWANFNFDDELEEFPEEVEELVLEQQMVPTASELTVPGQVSLEVPSPDLGDSGIIDIIMPYSSPTPVSDRPVISELSEEATQPEVKKKSQPSTFASPSYRRKAWGTTSLMELMVNDTTDWVKAADNKKLMVEKTEQGNLTKPPLSETNDQAVVPLIAVSTSQDDNSSGENSTLIAETSAVEEAREEVQSIINADQYGSFSPFSGDAIQPKSEITPIDFSGSADYVESTDPSPPNPTLLPDHDDYLNPNPDRSIKWKSEELHPTHPANLTSPESLLLAEMSALMNHDHDAYDLSVNSDFREYNSLSELKAPAEEQETLSNPSSPLKIEVPSLLVDGSAIIQELEADAMVKNVTKFQEYLPENFSNFDEEAQEAVSQEAFNALLSYTSPDESLLIESNKDTERTEFPMLSDTMIHAASTTTTSGSNLDNSQSFEFLVKNTTMEAFTPTVEDLKPINFEQGIINSNNKEDGNNNIFLYDKILETPIESPILQISQADEESYMFQDQDVDIKAEDRKALKKSDLNPLMSTGFGSMSLVDQLPSDFDSIIMRESDWKTPVIMTWSEDNNNVGASLSNMGKVDNLHEEENTSISIQVPMMHKKFSTDMSTSSLSPTDSISGLRDLPVWLSDADAFHLAKMPNLKRSRSRNVSFSDSIYNGGTGLPEFELPNSKKSVKYDSCHFLVDSKNFPDSLMDRSPITKNMKVNEDEKTEGRFTNGVTSKRPSESTYINNMEKYIEEMDKYSMQLLTIDMPVHQPSLYQLIPQSADLPSSTLSSFTVESVNKLLPAIEEEQEYEGTFLLNKQFEKRNLLYRKNNNRVQFNDDSDMPQLSSSDANEKKLHRKHRRHNSLLDPPRLPPIHLDIPQWRDSARNTIENIKENPNIESEEFTEEASPFLPKKSNEDFSDDSNSHSFQDSEILESYRFVNGGFFKAEEEEGTLPAFKEYNTEVLDYRGIEHERPESPIIPQSKVKELSDRESVIDAEFISHPVTPEGSKALEGIDCSLPTRETVSEVAPSSVNGATNMMVEVNSDGVASSDLVVKEMNGITNFSENLSSLAEPLGGILLQELEYLTDSLYSSEMRETYGYPTCLASANEYVVIAMSLGAIVIYDSSEQPIITLYPSRKDVGIVGCISVSADGRYLASGHSDGTLIFWDLTQLKEVLLIAPTFKGSSYIGRVGHMKGSSIIHVTFVGGKKRDIVSVDYSGNIFYHSITSFAVVQNTGIWQILGDINASSRAFKQIIYDLSALPTSDVGSHSADNYGLIAYITPNELRIIATRPTSEVLYEMSRPGFLNEDFGNFAQTGVLAWQPSSFKNPEEIDGPILAFAWDNYLILLRAFEHHTEQEAISLLKRKQNTVMFAQIGEWRCPCAITAAKWINEHTLWLYTSENEILIFDRESRNATERITVSNDLVWKHCGIEIVQSGSLKFEEYLNSYQNSISYLMGELLVLGTTKVMSSKLLSWNERVGKLVQNGHVLKAMDVVCAALIGDPGTMMYDLPLDEGQREQILRTRLIELILLSIHTSNTSTLNLSKRCIRICIKANMQDVIFEDIYELLKTKDDKYGTEASRYFLKALIPFILSGKIREVPPLVAQDLLEHLKSKPRLFERCILNVNVMSFDTDRLSAFCRKFKLWEGLMRFWNTTVKDWVSPVVEMLPHIRQHLEVIRKNPPPSFLSLHHSNNLKVIFPYIKNTLLGLSYPSSECALEVMDAQLAKTSLYQFLFARKCLHWPTDGGEIVRTGVEDDIPFPYLRLLLRLDSNAFLNTLSDAFDNTFLDTSPITLENPGAWRSGISRQAMVDSIMEVLSLQEHGVIHFNGPDLINLYCFIAHTAHKHSKVVNLDASIIRHLIMKLAMEYDSPSYDRRQTAVQELLHVHIPEYNSSLVDLLISAKFFRVLETIYRTERKFDKVVETYLRDDSRRHKAIDCVRKLLSEKSKSVEKGKLIERKQIEVRKSVWTLLPEFVEIDGRKAAAMVRDLFDAKHEDALKQLQGNSDLEYRYLKGLLDTSYYYKKRSKSTIVASKDVSPRLHVRYISLMCAEDANSVCGYLQRNQGHYPVEDALALCQLYAVIDGIVWLLETREDRPRALEAVLVRIQQMVRGLVSRASELRQRGFNVAKSDLLYLKQTGEKIASLFRMAIDVCERACRVVQNISDNPDQRAQLEKECEDMWFDLIVAYVNTFRIYKQQGLEVDLESTQLPVVNLSLTIMRSDLRGILNQIFNTVGKTFVPFPSLILRLVKAQPETPKIVNSPLTMANVRRRPCAFSDIKDIFFGAIEMYRFEEQAIEIGNQLLRQDVYQLLRSNCRQRARGWRLNNLECSLCKLRVFESSEPQDSDIKVFRCGHAFHSRCINKIAWSKAQSSQLLATFTLKCIYCENAQNESKGGWFSERQP